MPWAAVHGIHENKLQNNVYITLLFMCVHTDAHVFVCAQKKSRDIETKVLTVVTSVKVRGKSEENAPLLYLYIA